MSTDERLYLAQCELEDAQRAYLRERLWTYSSSHPDCVWRWTKTWNGETYHLSTAAAISMEFQAGQDPDQIDEEA